MGKSIGVQNMKYIAIHSAALKQCAKTTSIYEDYVSNRDEMSSAFDLILV